ncbi:MAG: TetR/AcrR family transcriptional regulator [Planctomycetota bacterium]|jgi:AcrR family transcriptional regulator
MTERAQTRRAQRRQAKTRRILTAALDLVAREGIDALKMKPLARGLDIAVGAVYRYFPSKAALLVGMQQKVLGDLRACFVEVLEQVAAGAEQRGASEHECALLPILAAAHVYAALPAAVPDRFAVLQRIVGDPQHFLDQESGVVAYQAMIEVLTPLAEAFRAAQGGRVIAPADSVKRAILFWSALHGTLQIRKFSRFDPENVRPAELTLEAALALVRGFGAREEPLRQANAALLALNLAEPIRRHLLGERAMEGETGLPGADS